MSSILRKAYVAQLDNGPLWQFATQYKRNSQIALLILLYSSETGFLLGIKTGLLLAELPAKII